MRFPSLFLVNPSSDGYYRAYLPTGLGYVAERLRRRGIAYEVLDLDLGYGLAHLLRRLETARPAALALGMMTYRYGQVYAMLGAIRLRHPDLPIIVGGPHVAAVGPSVLRDCPAVDYAIAGEGEDPLEALCMGAALTGIPGLLYRRDGAVVENPPGVRRLDPARVDFPTYAGFELDRYPARIIPLVTTRGCPHGCSFCNVSVSMGRTLRKRHPSHVAEEVAYWRARGIERFAIADDTFTEDPEHAVAVCEAILALGGPPPEIACGNGLRADRCGPELLGLLRRAGVGYVAFGAESGDAAVLARIGKGQSLEAVERAVLAAVGASMGVKLHFLVGAPGETYGSFRASLRFARRFPLRDVSFNNLIPYPGTAIYRWVLARGLFLVPPRVYLDVAAYHGREPVFDTPEFPARQRRRALREGWRATRQVRRRYLEERWAGLGLAAPVLARLFSFPPVERVARSWVPLKRLIVRTGYRLGLR